MGTLNVNDFDEDVLVETQAAVRQTRMREPTKLSAPAYALTHHRHQLAADR